MSMKWKNAERAPDELWNVAICGRVTCPCGKGAVVVLTGGRMGGEWVIDFNHSLDITHYMELPKPPIVQSH